MVAGAAKKLQTRSPATTKRFAESEQLPFVELICARNPNDSALCCDTDLRKDRKLGRTDLLGQVSNQLSQQGLRVDAPLQLNLNSQASGMPDAWEIPFPLESPLVRYSLNTLLFPLAQSNSVSIGVRPSVLPRGAPRLVFFDMDSTLIRQETIDELGRQKGVYPEISKITEAAMRGEMDYDESLRRRVELLRGLPVSQLEKVFLRLEPTSGAKELIESLRSKGHKTAVLSGGFTFAADRLKKKLGLHYSFSNSLEVSQQMLTGRVVPPFVNAAKKAALLEEVARKEKGFPSSKLWPLGMARTIFLCSKNQGSELSSMRNPS